MKFFDVSRELMDVLERTEGEAISKAAKLVADSIANGGILQSFGSGHSIAGALEIAGRAGGFIPSKCIIDPANGMYESIEGVGQLLIPKIRLDQHDVVVLISNSGRNPMLIELAEWIKEKGNPLIVVTALEVSKNSVSRHSSGKLLYQLADVVLDNHSVPGDASIQMEQMDTKICGTSTISAVLLLQQMIFEAVELLIERGIDPAIYKSANVDGGREYNDRIEAQYADQIFHI